MTETIRQSVFSESVQMSVLTPPRNVYSQTSKTVANTLRIKGKFNGPNTSICKNKQTKNKRTDAPSIFDIKKNHAPVL